MKKILVVSPIKLSDESKTFGNTNRILTYCKTLKEFGHEIGLLVHSSENEDFLRPYCDYVFKTNDSGYPWDRFDRAKTINRINSLIRNHNFKAVIVNYFFYSDIFDEIDDSVIKIVDSHDIWYKRTDGLIKVPKEKEFAALNKADIILAIQEEEQKEFEESKLITKKVIKLHHVYSIKKILTENADSIGYIGNDVHSYIAPLIEFIDNHFKHIKEEFPNIILNLYGKMSINDILTQKYKNNPSIKLNGFVDNLEEVYKNRIIINPVKSGSGLKIKCVEALCSGKPLVTTSNGAQGLKSGAGKAFLVGDNWETFTDNIIKILSDANLRKSLQDNALRFAQQNFSKEIVYKDLLKELE